MNEILGCIQKTNGIDWSWQRVILLPETPFTDIIVGESNCKR
jgi:hypothetical protein